MTQTWNSGAPRPQRWISLARRLARRLLDKQGRRNVLAGRSGSDGSFDEVENPAHLQRLNSYARAVSNREIECRWGSEFATDLSGIIWLNPHYPLRASAVDRKIVVDARLEHELRGHWQYTPRAIFEQVLNWAKGQLPEPDPFWGAAEVVKHRQGVIPLFNILEDGRIETRLRWSQPEVYKVIAAGDRIIPRWKCRGAYKPAPRAYAALKRRSRHRPQAQCPICGTEPAPEGVSCEKCFTVKYRWEQITGLLLLAGLPPHTAPVDLVEAEVRQAFQTCVPHLAEALRGTALDVFQEATEILRVLIARNMVPPDPEVNHLEMNDATGEPGLSDTAMGEQSANRSGLDKAQIAPKAIMGQTVDNRDKVAAGESGQKQGNQSAEPANGNDANTLPAILATLAQRDLNDCDFAIALDADALRKEAQRKLDSALEEAELAATLSQIMIASGISGGGAGPGLGVEMYRTPERLDVYQLLRSRNSERARRLAREIRELMTAVMYTAHFQRSGRLDRSQLVNATARQRTTIFEKPKANLELKLAVSILVDVSGSMAGYNLPAAYLQGTARFPSAQPEQLADAVVTCVLALNQLGAAYEVRAFGSLQWLAKGLYDTHMDGLGGLPGLDNGGTAMDPAIQYARLALIGRTEPDQLIVVMTDGAPFDPDRVTKEVKLARLAGIRVLGVLFANEAESRSATDPAMARIFGPGSFTVIHSLDIFPQKVGLAIKDIIRWRSVSQQT